MSDAFEIPDHYNKTNIVTLNEVDITTAAHEEIRKHEYRHYRNDREMNKKYPELDAINYDEYDKMRNEIIVHEKLTGKTDE